MPILATEQDRSPIVILQTMCQETNRFFNLGKNPCLWAVLAMEETSDTLFHGQISSALTKWIDSIAQVLISAGIDRTMAQQRSEDAIITIQGALIVSRGLRDHRSFQRVLQQLPQQLCQDISRA